MGSKTITNFRPGFYLTAIYTKSLESAVLRWQSNKILRYAKPK